MFCCLHCKITSFCKIFGCRRLGHHHHHHHHRHCHISFNIRLRSKIIEELSKLSMLGTARTRIAQTHLNAVQIKWKVNHLFYLLFLLQKDDVKSSYAVLVFQTVKLMCVCMMWSLNRSAGRHKILWPFLVKTHKINILHIRIYCFLYSSFDDFCTPRFIFNSVPNLIWTCTHTAPSRLPPPTPPLSLPWNKGAWMNRLSIFIIIAIYCEFHTYKKAPKMFIHLISDY